MISIFFEFDCGRYDKQVERGVVMSRLIEEARLCNLERRHQHFVRRSVLLHSMGLQLCSLN